MGKGEHVIDFLVHRDPFRVLGRLARTHVDDGRLTIWFGIGLASIVVIRQAGTDVPQTLKEFSGDLLVGEHWDVNGGSVVAISYSGNRSSRVVPDIEVPAALTQGDEPTAVFEEFFLSLGLALRRAGTYTPSEVPVLTGLESEIRALMANVAYLGGDRSPDDIPDDLRDYDLADGIVREQLYQQAMDKVVQVNSSLSYLISQAYRGGPPLLQSASLVQRHSLLGIGRAHRALTNLVREIEHALHARSVRESIVRAWSSWPALAGFTTGGSAIDASTWGTLRLPDVLLRDTPDEDQHKLTYFSGRLGFRESEYTVVAAIQALAGGDSPQWHISTMTHEVLHGHVREVCNAIFGKVRPDEPRVVNEFWQFVFARFRKQMRDGCAADWKLIDSARNLLLHHVCLVAQMGSLDRPGQRAEKLDGADLIGKLAVPRDDDEFLVRVESEFRNITEVMVHVLDLYYFFDDDAIRYLITIWRSWESVPSVMRDTRQYVLRSLLSCASLDEGDPISRFLQARQRCLDALQQIVDADRDRFPVVQKAIELLAVAPTSAEESDERSRAGSNTLFQPFYAALAIVDFTRHCIASERVKDALFGLQVQAAEDPESNSSFPIPEYEFADRTIDSVAEFASWRARQATINERSATERNAAWLFVACGRIDGTE